MIKKVSVYQLHIPFQFQITHNLAKRTTSESILVVIEDKNGNVGCGEGAPREYVTGETISASITKAESLIYELPALNFYTTKDIVNNLRIQGQSPVAISAPSVWCAFETACFDLFCKSQKFPYWKLFSKEVPEKDFGYSAVIPMLPFTTQENIFNLVTHNKIRHVKLKVNNVETGIEQVEFARSKLGKDVDIRVDANAAFSTSQAITFLDKVKKYSIGALEQPVAKDDVNGLKEIKNSSDGVLIIADESINTIRDAEILIKENACHGFNIRLSKCGGILNCLKLCQLAQDNKLLFQIGCHVGESSILSALGRHLAILRSNYLYLEGSFSKYMLIDDITNEDISFGYRGTAGQLTRPGLGVNINFDKISKWAELKHTIVL